MLQRFYSCVYLWLLSMVSIIAASLSLEAATVVATVSGSTATLQVSQSTLATAFQDEYGSGLSVDVASVHCEYWSSNSTWRLVATAILSGEHHVVSVLLDQIGNYLYITHTSLG